MRMSVVTGLAGVALAFALLAGIARGNEVTPDGDVVPPVEISRVEPEYSKLAKQLGREGIVILQTVITKEGRVENVKVLQGLGVGLDEAAMTAVAQWSFRPGTLDGEPVDVVFTLLVQFRLNAPDPVELPEGGTVSSSRTRKAARDGHPQAQYIFGRLLLEGLGTDPDIVEAHVWLSLAAQQGHEQARKLLEEIEPKLDAEQLELSKRLQQTYSK